MTQQQPTATELSRMVRVSLWRDWDPIGINDISDADDEYDSYVGSVCSLLLSGADSDTIRQHLSKIETDYIGLSSPCPRLSHLDEIVTKLMSMVGRQ